MGDVLARLMRWMETSDIDDADVVLRDAITEIAGLRARLDERRMMRTLTDEEREAIGWAIMECESMPTTFSRRAADTLRALLERLG